MLQLKAVDWRSVRNAQREATRAAAQAALEADIPEDEQTPSAKLELFRQTSPKDLFTILGIEPQKKPSKEDPFADVPGLSGVVETWELPVSPKRGASTDETRTVNWHNAEVHSEDPMHTVDVGARYLQPVVPGTQRWMQQCTCVRWGPQDDGIAAGFFDGCVRIFSGLAGEEEKLMEANLGYMKKTKNEGWRIDETPEADLAVTQIRWRPSKHDRFLAAATSSGLLALLQVTSTTSTMPQIRCAEGTIVDDEFLGVDWACDGSRIAAAGRQKKISVFDWEMNLVSEHGSTLLMSDTAVSGHKQKVIALRAHTKDPNFFVTAGMDNMVILWDIRQPGAAGHFSGPLITGDGIDMSGDGSALLTASQRDDDQVELWDMRSLGERWFTSGPRVVGEDGALVGTTPITAGFSKDPSNRFIFSAGSSNNSAKVSTTPALPNDGVAPFGDNPPPLGEVAEYRGPPCPFTCLDGSYSGWRAAFGSIDGTVSVIDMKRKRGVQA